jgi:hypothetical protein
MLHVRYVHLTKAKSIRKRQTHPLVRGEYDRKGSVAKEILKGLGAKTNWLAVNRQS